MATAVTAFAEQERAAHVTSGRAEQTARRYLAVFFLTCLGLYVVPFAAERMPAMQPFSTSDWGRRLDYNYTLAHMNADVVIFGDSSALYSIDTPRLSRELGMKVINLPQTASTLAVTGDVPLRRYLRDNTTPRAIVFAFTPWNRDFRATKTTHLYEGIEQSLRHGSTTEVLHMIRSHPSQVATFPFAFYLVHSRMTRPWKKNGDAPYRLRDGFEPYPYADVGTAAADCAFPPEMIAATKDDSMQQLRSDVDESRTTVVTVMSVVPQCKGADRLRALYGTSLTVLPPKDFVGDEQLAHLLPPYTNETTDRMAAILRDRLFLHPQ